MTHKIKNKQLIISSTFDINNQRMTNVDTPVEANDAVNKDFIDYTAINYALGTGLYTGGTLAYVSDTNFSIEDGIGYFVESISKEITEVVWTGLTSVALIAYGPTDITMSVGIDQNGEVFQQIPKFSIMQRQTIVVLGELLIHPTQRVLMTTVGFFPVLSRDLPSVVDFSLSDGPKNTQGNNVSANGVNLQMDCTAGKITGYSVNSINSLISPNESTLPSITSISGFTTRYDGGEWVYSGATNVLDPTVWSNGTASLQSSTPSKYNLRIIYRGVATGAIFVFGYPTQTQEYANITEAESNLNALGIPIPDELVGITVPLAWVILRGNADDLSDSVQAKFVPIQAVSNASGSVANNAADVSYDPTSSNHLNATNVQDAIEEINNTDFSYVNQDMTALSGTSGIYLATNTVIGEAPVTIVRVQVNGLKVTVGNATTNADCFFSNDAGSTAKSYDLVALNDQLYWNGDIAKYQLEVTDLIDFVYMART